MVPLPLRKLRYGIPGNLVRLRVRAREHQELPALVRVELKPSPFICVEEDVELFVVGLPIDSLDPHGNRAFAPRQVPLHRESQARMPFADEQRLSRSALHERDLAAFLRGL